MVSPARAAARVRKSSSSLDSGGSEGEDVGESTSAVPFALVRFMLTSSASRGSRSGAEGVWVICKFEFDMFVSVA